MCLFDALSLKQVLFQKDSFMYYRQYKRAFLACLAFFAPCFGMQQETPAYNNFWHYAGPACNVGAAAGSIGFFATRSRAALGVFVASCATQQIRQLFQTPLVHDMGRLMRPPHITADTHTFLQRTSWI